jgi:hypothetical protein
LHDSNPKSKPPNFLSPVPDMTIGLTPIPFMGIVPWMLGWGVPKMTYFSTPPSGEIRLSRAAVATVRSRRSTGPSSNTE